MQRWEFSPTPECLHSVTKVHIDPDRESESVSTYGVKDQFLTTGNVASVYLVHYQLCIILNTDL